MFYLGQANGGLSAIKSDGTVTALTLPSGITISTSIRGVFAVLAQQIFFVYAGTKSLWIDPYDLTVRPMHILPPLNSPTIAAGSSTGLTGSYHCGVAYAIKSSYDGTIINRSPVTGPSLAVSLANKDAAYTNIPVSPDTNVNCRILYRTAAGGTDLFECLQIDDNVTTAINDALSDTALDSLPADPDLGVAPGAIPGTALKLLVAWKSRLWGVSARVDEQSDVRYTEVNQFYGWNDDNILPAYPKGEDSFGIVGLAPRRNVLGLLKRSRVLSVIGSNSDDFEVVIIAEGMGCCAPESVVVIRDKAYWLGLDGVYRWDDSGVTCISRDTVDGWFTTDTYFNRAKFPNAFGSWNPKINAYELGLAATGSSNIDRWVNFHIDANNGKGEWLGPHETSAFTPTARARLQDDTGLFLPAMGASDGYIYLQNNSTYSDVSGAGATSAISAQIDTKWHADKSPDVFHHFGRLSVLARIESAGTLTITPYVGGLDASAGTAMSMDLTRGRQILNRIGNGRLMKLSFTQATAARRFLLYGYEVSPVFEVGKR